MLKGQLFSLDLMIAIAIMITASAIALHSIELVERGFSVPSSHAVGALAEWRVGGNPLHVPPAHCIQYSNGTSNCAGFECNGNVFVSRRITICDDGVCLLEVRSCE